jgi:tetratricopeptide (TPR) repeat protein
VGNLGRSQALARAIRVRERAAQKLGDWSHAHFLAEEAAFDRLLARGELPAANAAAQQLPNCLAAGETAYPVAAYDIAMAHYKLGQALHRRGAAEAALLPLAEALRRFQQLVDADEGAENMVATTIGETGNCLIALGRLDAAAEAIEEAIRRHSTVGNRRSAAVGKGQLASVRLRQKRYQEALKSEMEARDTFQELAEPRAVAVSWHGIGRVHHVAGDLEASEEAYRQSLAISVRENDLPGQARMLHQLGILYSEMGRAEEGVTFSRRAAEVFSRSGDLANEGAARSGLASTLLVLGRYEEARQALQRAIECNEPYGHAAEPWTSWELLRRLERAAGHTQDAQAARIHAIETYLAYRRDGGNSQSSQFPLFSVVALAIQENIQDHAVQKLNDLKPGNPAWFTALIRKLQSVLAGNRDPALAADTEMDFLNAAELRLLLDTLNQAEAGQRGQE